MGYIELETAIEILRKSHKSHAENYRDEVLLARDIRLLKEIPTADVVEVVHGEWTKEVTDMWHCSICLHPCLLNGGGDYVLSNFCHNCGAKMGGASK